MIPASYLKGETMNKKLISIFGAVALLFIASGVFAQSARGEVGSLDPNFASNFDRKATQQATKLVLLYNYTYAGGKSHTFQCDVADYSNGSGVIEERVVVRKDCVDSKAAAAHKLSNWKFAGWILQYNNGEKVKDMNPNTWTYTTSQYIVGGKYERQPDGSVKLISGDPFTAYIYTKK